MFPNAPYVTKIICQNIHRSYHNNAGEKKIENASLFLRLGLPSTAPSRKTNLFELEEFDCDKEAFRKR